MPEVSDLPGGTLAVKAYPNPVNNTTRLAYVMPQAGRLSIKIYDVQGRLVRTLIDTNVEAGPGQVVWDGKGRAGKVVAPGVYRYRATTDGRTATGSIVILK